jgi:hypothetical protein
MTMIVEKRANTMRTATLFPACAFAQTVASASADEEANVTTASPWAD